MSAKTKCPHCSKVLQLKSEAAFGKKVACPKCSTPFTVEPLKSKPKPAVEEPVEEEYEDYGDSYDDNPYEDYGDSYDDDYGEASGDDQYDDDEATPKKLPASGSSKKASSKKKSKKKKKAAGMPPWLTYVAFGLAGVLVLGGLAGVVVMAVGSFGGSNAMNLEWMPEDADLFVRIEPDELWDAPILAKVRESDLVKNVIEQATQQGTLKLGISDIDSITLAGVDMVDMYQQKMTLLGGTVGDPQLAKQANGKMIGVVRLNKDVTEEEYAEQPEDRKREHNGKTYYVTPNSQAVYRHDARTMIVGEVDQVTAAIDRGPAEPRVARIDFINTSHQVVVVMAPPKLLDAEARSKIQPKSGNATQQKLQTALDQNSQAFCFGLSLTSNIEMELQLQCFGASEAEALKTELDSMLAEMKSQFETSTAQVPPQFASFVSLGQEVISSLKTQKSGNEVALAAAIPGRITTVVEEAIASNPMAGMMLNGMAQQLQRGMTPGLPPGSGPPDPSSLNPPPGLDPLPPSSGNPEDEEAALTRDKQNAVGELDAIRGRIKSTTGSIQNAVPGGK